jgi:hypothetical protein
MIMINRATSDAVREAYIKGGEEPAIVELRRFFPIEDDNAARQCAIKVASWRPFAPGRYARRYHFPTGSKRASSANR